MRYVAYNKIYYKGKAKGHKFVAESAKTKKELLKKVRVRNSQWNKFSSKGDYRTRTVEIKKRKW